MCFFVLGFVSSHPLLQELDQVPGRMRPAQGSKHGHGHRVRTVETVETTSHEVVRHPHPSTADDGVESEPISSEAQSSAHHTRRTVESEDETFSATRRVLGRREREDGTAASSASGEPPAASASGMPRRRQWTEPAPSSTPRLVDADMGGDDGGGEESEQDAKGVAGASRGPAPDTSALAGEIGQLRAAIEDWLGRQHGAPAPPSTEGAAPDDGIARLHKELAELRASIESHRQLEHERAAAAAPAGSPATSRESNQPQQQQQQEVDKQRQRQETEQQLRRLREERIRLSEERILSASRSLSRQGSETSMSGLPTTRAAPGAEEPAHDRTSAPATNHGGDGSDGRGPPPKALQAKMEKLALELERERARREEAETAKGRLLGQLALVNTTASREQHDVEDRIARLEASLLGPPADDGEPATASSSRSAAGPRRRGGSPNKTARRPADDTSMVVPPPLPSLEEDDPATAYVTLGHELMSWGSRLAVIPTHRLREVEAAVRVLRDEPVLGFSCLWVPTQPDALRYFALSSGEDTFIFYVTTPPRKLPMALELLLTHPKYLKVATGVAAGLVARLWRDGGFYAETLGNAEAVATESAGTVDVLAAYQAVVAGPGLGPPGPSPDAGRRCGWLLPPELLRPEELEYAAFLPFAARALWLASQAQVDAAGGALVDPRDQLRRIVCDLCGVGARS